LWVAHRTAGNPAFAPSSQDVTDLVNYLYGIDANKPELALPAEFDGCPAEFPTYIAHLAGAQEVPPVVTDGAAEAVFQLSADETQLTYEVRISGLDPAQITQAHLHVGPAGFNGPVVLFLVNGPPPTTVLKGTLTEADLIPNADVSVATFADFVAALKAGDV